MTGTTQLNVPNFSGRLIDPADPEYDDLRGMKGITVDAEQRIARAEAGLTWGKFDAATQEHGLAVTGGRVTDTGIGGLALGSGSGWLERKRGYTCDNLVKA